MSADSKPSYGPVWIVIDGGSNRVLGASAKGAQRAMDEAELAPRLNARHMRELREMVDHFPATTLAGVWDYQLSMRPILVLNEKGHTLDIGNVVRERDALLARVAELEAERAA